MPTEPSTAQPVPAWSDDHRATIVAGLRAMADFVEQRTDIPAPDYLTEQYSIVDSYEPGTFRRIVRPDAEKIALVEHVAGILGVEVKISDKSVYCKYEVADRATYTVHGNLAGGAA